MWFGSQRRDSEKNAEPRGNAKPGPRGADRRRGLPPAAKIVARLALLLGALAAAAWLVWETGALLFWENPRYAIRKLVIRIDGPSLTPPLIRSYTQLGEGTNLFAFPLARAQDALERVPEVKSAVLQRILPDSVVIDVVERVPLARLGRWESLGVDREGRVFSLRSGGAELPVISGGGERRPRPGSRVGQGALNALEVVEVCKRSRIGEKARLASIDVSSRDYLELYLAAGERAKLAWKGMGTGTPESRQCLEKKLEQLAQALRLSEERGRKLVRIDLTFDDPYVPAQEY